MKILVTGVEQYIGGGIARFLSQEGYSVIPYTFTKNVQSELIALFKKHAIQCVIHVAIIPDIQYIHALLHAVRHCTIPFMILCSTADVYGLPMSDKIEEKQFRKPITRSGILYNAIELAVEQFSLEYPSMTIAIPRIFMVTGADTVRGIGPIYEGNNDFMVRLIRSFANRKIKFTFYGDDYATSDGYPIRDFIHIIDVCEAIQHILMNLENQGIPLIEYNIGSGEGHSLSDVVNRASEVLQMPIHTTVQPRKEDEVARLVADITRAKLLLNWKPRYPLDQCVLTTWHWCMRQL